MQFPDDTPRRGGDNLLPMINVVFLLLIFFLISAEMTPPEPFEVSSPEAHLTEEANGSFTLYTDAQGRLAFNGVEDAASGGEQGGDAQGDVVITMDADMQDSPDEIPELYQMVSTQYDLVSGWKQKRFDPITKTVPTKLYNAATRAMTGIQLHDFNCGLKAYRNEVIKSVEVYGEMHRYIPVLAKNAGFSKIGEKVVIHQARKYGSSKFGMSRFINGFLDLITIWFLSTFGKRPMHLFGLLGSIMFIIGFLFAFYLGIDKLFINTTGRLITERPQFYLSLTAMLIGTQLFLAGFLGEIILRTKNNEERYKISEVL